MLNTESSYGVDAFVLSVREEFNQFLDRLDRASLEKAAEMIVNAQEKGGRLHITGIGKPGHVSNYMASLFSSTGNPCYFLHGTEAVHGSCGQLVAGDVVIAISNSGETQELKSTVLAIKDNGCSIIGVTGNPDSWLAKESEVCLYAGVGEEGGPLNRAPRNSILAETFVLQTLSVLLQVKKDWTPEQYVRCHPGGQLGKLREDEKKQ